MKSSKILSLGGAGKICSEAVRDLVEYSDASTIEKITIADANLVEAEKLRLELHDDRVDCIALDICQEESAIQIMSEYDIVMDGTTIHLNDISTRCIARAGCHGINLNGFGEEFKYNNIFKEKGRLHIPGFGMTPGTTNLMAKFACEGMETIYAIRVSHGAFRPFAFSRSIAETTRYEYDPALPGRVVWENGQFIQVPPFARPRLIALPEPYGTHEQYIIPHAETVTLAEYLKDRSPRLIEVRGTWPPRTMKLVRALHEWGFLRNELGVMDCIAEYLLQSTEGTTTDLYGYALHVEVEGEVNGVPLRRTLWHTHPASDGSVAGWEKLRAYTRCVGIPMGVAVHWMAQGLLTETGARIPEHVFADPELFFADLAKRGIHIHQKEERIEAQ